MGSAEEYIHKISGGTTAYRQYLTKKYGKYEAPKVVSSSKYKTVQYVKDGQTIFVEVPKEAEYITVDTQEGKQDIIKYTIRDQNEVYGLYATIEDYRKLQEEGILDRYGKPTGKLLPPEYIQKSAIIQRQLHPEGPYEVTGPHGERYSTTEPSRLQRQLYFKQPQKNRIIEAYETLTGNRVYPEWYVLQPPQEMIFFKPEFFGIDLSDKWIITKEGDVIQDIPAYAETYGFIEGAWQKEIKAIGEIDKEVWLGEKPGLFSKESIILGHEYIEKKASGISGFITGGTTFGTVSQEYQRGVTPTGPVITEDKQYSKRMEQSVTSLVSGALIIPTLTGAAAMAVQPTKTAKSIVSDPFGAVWSGAWGSIGFIGGAYAVGAAYRYSPVKAGLKKLELEGLETYRGLEFKYGPDYYNIIGLKGRRLSIGTPKLRILSEAQIPKAFTVETGGQFKIIQKSLGEKFYGVDYARLSEGVPIIQELGGVRTPRAILKKEFIKEAKFLTREQIDVTLLAAKEIKGTVYGHFAARSQMYKTEFLLPEQYANYLAEMGEINYYPKATLESGTAGEFYARVGKLKPEIHIEKSLTGKFRSTTIAHELIHYKTPDIILKMDSRLPYSMQPSEIIAYGLESPYKQFKVQYNVGRVTADIDLQLPPEITELQATQFTKQLAQKLQGKGYEVRVDSRRPTLIETKVKGKWHHAVDIHYGTESLFEYPKQPSSIYGGELGQKPYTQEGIKTMRLSEQLVRKGGSALTIRKGETGFKVGPEAHRIKDVVDFPEIAEVLAGYKFRGGEQSLLRIERFKALYPELSTGKGASIPIADYSPGAAYYAGPKIQYAANVYPSKPLIDRSSYISSKTSSKVSRPIAPSRPISPPVSSPIISRPVSPKLVSKPISPKLNYPKITRGPKYTIPKSPPSIKLPPSKTTIFKPSKTTIPKSKLYSPPITPGKTTTVIPPLNLGPKEEKFITPYTETLKFKRLNLPKLFIKGRM